MRTEARDVPAHRRHSWTLVWGLGLATACLVLGFALGLRKGQEVPAEAPELARHQKLFREVAGLFPNRLQAIVIEGGQVRLELSEAADVPTSPPLLVEICRGGRWRTFITFSGQQVRVNGDTYDVLYNADGQVIVAGPVAAWIGATELAGPSDVKVRARLLEGRS